MTFNRESGFTFVELVIVIVLLGIISLATVGFIKSSVQGYSDLSRRDGMAATLRVAVDRMAREVRNALPNSARTTGDASGECLEFIPILAATQYINAPISSAANGLTAVPFADPPKKTGPGQAGRAAIFPINTAAIYQTGSPSVISPVITTPADELAGSSVVTLNFSSPQRFTADSPTKRVFIVDNPVSFCLVGDRLYRYSGYSRSSTQPTPATGLPSSEPKRALLATPIAGRTETTAAFRVVDASLQRNAIVMLEFRVQQDNTMGSSESLLIQQEVQVRNGP